MGDLSTNIMKKIIPILIIVLLLVAGAYWYFFLHTSSTGTTGDGSTNSSGGFSPFGRPTTNTGNQTPTTNTNSNSPTGTNGSPTQGKIPTLRLLSNDPVGGYGASTTVLRIVEPIVTIPDVISTSTASTTPKKPVSKVAVATSTIKLLPITIVRWVDRGRGNVLEARSNTLDITTLSNTVIPKIFESAWNKNVTSFIGTLFQETGSKTSVVYADLKARILPKVATTTASASSTIPIITNTASLTPFELKGKNLPENLIAYATSPNKDKIFMLVNEGGTGVGYTSTFDGKLVTQIFTTPLTQVNVEWPEEKTIAITTKGTASEGGYLYFVDPKTGFWRKILGPIVGISTKTSMDAKHVLVSTTGSAKNVLMSVYTVSEKKGIDAVVRTIADKCVWGNFYKDMVYCAAPSQPVEATYPDDWYKGAVSFVDKIWQINSGTGEIKLVSSLVDASDRVIDAINLGLDNKDDFLIFMNKNDLSLWSLDLVSSN